jgi:hypothetical protein
MCHSSLGHSQPEIQRKTEGDIKMEEMFCSSPGHRRYKERQREIYKEEMFCSSPRHRQPEIQRKAEGDIKRETVLLQSRT